MSWTAAVPPGVRRVPVPDRIGASVRDAPAGRRNRMTGAIDRHIGRCRRSDPPSSPAGLRVPACRPVSPSGAAGPVHPMGAGPRAAHSLRRAAIARGRCRNPPPSGHHFTVRWAKGCPALPGGSACGVRCGASQGGGTSAYWMYVDVPTTRRGAVAVVARPPGIAEQPLPAGSGRPGVHLASRAPGSSGFPYSACERRPGEHRPARDSFRIETSSKLTRFDTPGMT